MAQRRSPDPTARCGALTRAGMPCDQSAGAGTGHLGVGRCKLHGGSSPQAEKSGAVELAGRRAQHLLAQLGKTGPVVNPLRDLLDLAGETEDWLAVCRDMAQHAATLVTEDNFGSPQVAAEALLYGQALDRTERVLAQLVKLDLDARLVRLEEAQAAAVLVALDAMVTRYIPARDRAAARALFGQRVGDMLAASERTAASEDGSPTIKAEAREGRKRGEIPASNHPRPTIPATPGDDDSAGDSATPSPF